MTITIYHNPRCSKSRKSLEIIEQSGIRPTIIEYLKEPPDADTILRLASLLDAPVAELLRRGEAEFQEASDLPDLNDNAALAEWLAKNPKLLQRPIVVNDAQGKAVIGRPPENVLPLVSR